MSRDRWIMNRIGLINFWYYDEEEFQFADGKLLLRGANGSGKSVTMQSFIPLLLDGNKSPERLDPFGSRARKLENYLLGEEDLGRDENTGYIYMEFKKENSNKFLTIGMGLNAKRGRSLDFWGFTITDGRRVGKDFFLYRRSDGKIPFSKRELENRLGDGGELKTKQKDYMAMVNKYLFGFDDIEDYDELIKLLIQLRTPKLSKDFKPTVIYEILDNSLQPLTEDDLRPMSEAIENMDNIKNKLEELQLAYKEANKLKRSYDQYNHYILYDKSRNYICSAELLESKIKEKKKLVDNKLKLQEEYTTEEKKIEELEIQGKNIKEKEKTLRKHDSYELKEEISRLEDNINELKKDEDKKSKNLEEKKTKERELYEKIRRLDGDIESKISSINTYLEDMDLMAEEIIFHEQKYMKEELSSDLKREYNFDYIKNQLKFYKNNIIEIKRILQQERVKKGEYDTTLKELEGVKREREAVNKRLEEANLLFSEVKEEFIEKVYIWEKDNQEFKVPDEDLSQMSQKIIAYGFKTSYDDILTALREVYNRVEDSLKGIKQGLSLSMERYQDKYNEKEKELITWKEMKDPEPPREEKVVLNRNRLIGSNIPFIPLYKAIDFKEELSVEERGILEEALIDMGLLDALIVPLKYKEEIFKMDKDMADRYIFSEPKYLTYELSNKLKIDKYDVKGITDSDIDNALKSILLDSGEGTYINGDGGYGIGVVKGKVSKKHRPKFIGSTARNRYREEMIEKLVREREEIMEELRSINKDIDNIDKRLNRLEKEDKQFPLKDDLEVAYKGIKDETYRLEKIEEEIEKQEKKLDLVYEDLKKLKEDIQKSTMNIEIPVSLESFEEAEDTIIEYEESLNKLETSHIKLMQDVAIRKENSHSKNGIEIDIENMLYDLNVIERKIKENTDRLTKCKEQIRLSDYDEIEREIARCIELLDRIPKEIMEATQKSTAARTRFEDILSKIEAIEKEIESKKSRTEAHKIGFREEYHLGLVYDDILDNAFLKAKAIMEELKEFEGQNKTKEDYQQVLQEKFHDVRPFLTEYSPKIEIIFNTEVEESDVLEILLRQKRLQIKGKVRGKYIDLYRVLEYIKEGIEENERLLKDSDRQIFEDILAKSISKKIRAKIYHSEEWVKKMNDLMESMNTSSGLSFNLKWEKKAAETEEQMDTRRLVTLLKKDGHLLTEEELNELSSHFRSKIEEARRSSYESGKSQTFHQIMKDVLDYRRWFEFKLYFQKTNERSRELTNNAFDKFSGGEKAMAMYVPLFSAVYAKYEGARGDCPRIISLDEAFAGVDENNIRDMFRLLNELELNFIINSQILWGDYDTVNSLSICELLRPNNATEVAVLRYHWNGKVKSLVEEVGA